MKKLNVVLIALISITLFACNPQVVVDNVSVEYVEDHSDDDTKDKAQVIAHALINSKMVPSVGEWKFVYRAKESALLVFYKNKTEFSENELNELILMAKAVTEALNDISNYEGSYSYQKDNYVQIFPIFNGELSTKVYISYKYEVVHISDKDRQGYSWDYLNEYK